MIQVVKVEGNAYYREDSEYCAVGISLRQMDHCLRKNIQSVTTLFVSSKEKVHVSLVAIAPGPDLERRSTWCRLAAQSVNRIAG